MLSIDAMLGIDQYVADCDGALNRDDMLEDTGLLREL